MVRRDTGFKRDIDRASIAGRVLLELDCMQAEMLLKAQAERDDRTVTAKSFADVMSGVREGKFVLTPWCEDAESDALAQATVGAQEKRKRDPGLTSLFPEVVRSVCIPREQPPLESGLHCHLAIFFLWGTTSFSSRTNRTAGTQCFFSGRAATAWTFFGVSC